MEKTEDAYGYCYNNPINLVDPDGRQGEDWIKYRSKSGRVHVTYDSSINGMQEAKEKGYKNIEAVFAENKGARAGSGENINFFKDGKFTVDGAKYDVDDTSYFTKGGALISENKGILDAFGEWGPGALQDAGDAITLAALPVSMTGVGAPIAGIMVGVGSAFSAVGTGLEIVNDACEGNFSWKKTVIKAGLEFLPGKVNTPDYFGPGERILNDNIVNGVDRTIDQIDSETKMIY